MKLSNSSEQFMLFWSLLSIIFHSLSPSLSFPSPGFVQGSKNVKTCGITLEPVATTLCLLLALLLVFHLQQSHKLSSDICLMFF